MYNFGLGPFKSINQLTVYGEIEAEIMPDLIASLENNEYVVQLESDIQVEIEQEFEVEVC